MFRLSTCLVCALNDPLLTGVKGEAASVAIVDRCRDRPEIRTAATHCRPNGGTCPPRWRSRRGLRSGSASARPLEILRERHARGEIDKDEYDERRQHLSA